MVKLSDYLNYLYEEVIKSRQFADQLAIKTAKLYAKDEYLQYFKVPRYTMPSVKLEVPIKISEIDNRVKYDFKMDNVTFLREVNTKIEEVNKKEGLTLKPLVPKDLDTDSFKDMVKRLEKKDQKFVREKINVIDKINLPNLKVLPIKPGDFIKADGEGQQNPTLVTGIIQETLMNRLVPVSADLRNIFIDPNTTKADDKDKLMVMLNIEFVDEGIQIKSGKDQKGNAIEEIIID